MKISKTGYGSVRIEIAELWLLVDPLYDYVVQEKLPKQSADLVATVRKDLLGETVEKTDEYLKKFNPKKREHVTIVNNPGEYEIGGMVLRRAAGMPYMIVDHGDIRVVYISNDVKDIELSQLPDLGDIDVLVVPASGLEGQLQYDKLEKLIAKLDPSYLIPICTKIDGLKKEYKDSNSVKKFIEHFGFTHVTEEKKFTIKTGKERNDKIVEIVVLES